MKTTDEKRFPDLVAFAATLHGYPDEVVAAFAKAASARITSLLDRALAAEGALEEAGQYTEAHERLDELARERVAAAELERDEARERDGVFVTALVSRLGIEAMEQDPFALVINFLDAALPGIERLTSEKEAAEARVLGLVEALKAMVEKARGCERWDAENVAALAGVPFGSVSISCGDDGSDEFNVYPAGPNSFRFGGYRHLMPDASLDAALALVERVLPAETSFVLRKSTEGYWVRKGIPAGQWGVILNDAPDGWTVAHTPALALLAALLRTLTPSPATACSGDADAGEGRG